MFLPQRPYMIQGSLREQLLYPFPHRDLSDEQVRKVMEMVNLSDVFSRVDNDLGNVVDWTNVLSIGEQQRIAFARLFLSQPKFVFLDEATSALDEENQDLLYEKLRKSGAAYISVGHRNTLIKHHDRVLTLDPSGTWEIKDSGD